MSRALSQEQRRSAAPGPSPALTDRTTERRLIPATAQTTMAADSTRDLALGDFLFHLYRGSELLQENRFLDAKEELEFALTLQPADPKGQDLLGAVYFRLGHYPRAIQIYQALEHGFPDDASIKVNLALSYLKTGQAEAARRTLQEATRINPEHRRAWGYLGLALQNLGEVDQAQIAFERGGHPMMALRATERRQRVTTPAPAGGGAGIDDGMRTSAETAFSELEGGELRFTLADPGASTRGASIERASKEGASKEGASTNGASTHGASTNGASKPLFPPPLERPRPSLPSPARAIHAAPSLFADALEAPVALHARGVVLVRTTQDRAFGAKLESFRVVVGTVVTRVLHRRARDAETHEVLGGIGSPVVRVSGSAQLALGANAGHTLLPVTLENDLAFIREDALLGFELRLAYENGRLALEVPVDGSRGPGEGVHVVQLRGSGAVVLELAGELASVPCTGGRPLFVRREWIVGWLGRLLPRPLSPAESPGGQRGLIAFSGEGTVLICAA